MNRKDRFRYIADQLDRFASVPTEVLAEAVMRGGACVNAMTSGEPPELTGEDTADRDLAVQLCGGCLMQRECLELELRWSGPKQAGVFGALPEDDRREFYPYWRARRARRGGWGDQR